MGDTKWKNIFSIRIQQNGKKLYRWYWWFSRIFIEGEISNITYYKSGHLYFSIKDGKSQIKCAAFNYKLKRIPEDLKEGDLIKLFGDVGFYEVKGEFQVLVRYIEKQNALGSLYAKLEKVKEKLAGLGYFDEEHKKIYLDFLKILEL